MSATVTVVDGPTHVVTVLNPTSATTVTVTNPGEAELITVEVPGTRGEQGPVGPEPDLPTLSLLFENGLI